MRWIPTTTTAEAPPDISVEWTDPKSYLSVAAFILSIGVLEYVMFFQDLGHYFQADTVFWLYYRAHSLPEFLSGFVIRDAGGWYRPIGNQLLPFICFPWFGLEPAGYRIIVFVLFFIDTIAVFFLISQLTRRAIAAGVATLFFATHTVNTITTYDAAFAPELFYAFFYICSVIAYLRYTATNRKLFLVLSALSFVFALFSKESAITLPVTLFVLGILMEKGSLKRRTFIAIADLRWHFLIMAAYLFFAVGYLHVGGVTVEQLLNPPEQPRGPGTYDVVFGSSILRNTDLALTWAFNLPRGLITQPRDLPSWAITFLKSFRFAIALLAVFALLGRRRPWLLTGLAWFFISAVPTLLLRDHFLPYYLFLPIVGFSLVIGAVVDGLYERLTRFSALAANVVCLSPFVVLPFVCSISIWNEADGSRALGYSSRLALNSVSDMKTLLPQLKPNTTVYFINDAEPVLWWEHASGGLFKLYHNDESLHFRYSSRGEKILPNEQSSLLLFKLEDGHLRNLTNEFRAHPLQFGKYLLEYVDGPYTIETEPKEVVAGKDSYVLVIAGLHNTDVNIHYVVNEGPVEMFATHLDSQGRARFEVGTSTRRGIYRFIGFNLMNSPQASRSDAILRVR